MGRKTYVREESAGSLDGNINMAIAILLRWKDQGITELEFMEEEGYGGRSTFFILRREMTPEEEKQFELDEARRKRQQAEAQRQRELAELAALKAKYEGGA